jgi:aminopeptidase N
MMYSGLGAVKRAGAVLVIVLSVFATPQIGQTISGISATSQAPPVQWPRSHDYHVDHYRIEIGVDLSNRSISGTTTVTLEPFISGFKRIELDAGDMQIKSVKLDGGSPLQFKYEGNEKLFVTLDHGYSAGERITVAINYEAVPKQGLTFIPPDPSQPNRSYQVWSQGESQTNHYWFPCYDYPNDKATSETLITVDEKYRVISNGELVEVRDNKASNTKTWHWKMDRPYSSYLTSIIVGQFSEIAERFKSIPVVSYVYPNEEENARLSLGKIDQMVAFFSQKVGVDYPYPKYAQTTVGDFPGGMENISATTMTDTAVHDKRAQLDVSSDLLISHELAHQWFGDMLTCRDWGELWLNESFAEFFADLWTEHDLGEDQYHYEMRNNQTQYLQAWERGTRRPLVTNRYDDPDALFDVYVYPRGAATVDMLRFVLGEELFWKAINHYVQKYEWQNVDTEELIDAIAESTGQNLQWFFDEWIYKMGHPQFDVKWTYDEPSKSVKVAVKQTQKKPTEQPWFASPDFFTTPVDIAVTTASGEHVHRVFIDGPDKEFTLAVDSKPLIINFDRGNYIIKRVNFPKSDDELAYEIVHDQDSTGRLRAIDDTKARKGNVIEQALIQAALKDEFWGARAEAVAALGAVNDPAAEQALFQAAKDKDSRVRRAAVGGLVRYQDPQVAALLTNLTKTDPSYFVIADAAAGLGTLHSPDAYNVLVGLLAESSWQDTIRGGALRGLAALKDPRALDLALKYSQPGSEPALRAVAFGILAQYGKGNEQAFKILLAAIGEPSEQIVFAAMQAVGVLGDARALPALEDLRKRTDFPGEAREILEAEIARLKAASNGGSR